MIRNEKEYKEAVRRLEQDKEVIEKQRLALKGEKLSPGGLTRAMEPLLTFHQQLVEEVEWYEKVRRGDIETISRLSQMGRILIAHRIASGLSQKDLADMLKVAEAQVSRDERNEYHGISVDRAQKIMDLLHVKLKVATEIDETYTRRYAKAI